MCRQVIVIINNGEMIRIVAIQFAVAVDFYADFDMRRGKSAFCDRAVLTIEGSDFRVICLGCKRPEGNYRKGCVSISCNDDV